MEDIAALLHLHSYLIKIHSVIKSKIIFLWMNSNEVLAQYVKRIDVFCCHFKLRPQKQQNQVIIPKYDFLLTCIAS